MSERGARPTSVSGHAFIRCTACQNDFPARLWVIVIADERPDLAEKARAGTINDFECPHCKASETVESSLLYVDRINERAVFVQGFVVGHDEFLKRLSSYTEAAFSDLTRAQWEQFVATRLQTVGRLEELNEALARDPSVDAAKRQGNSHKDEKSLHYSELRELYAKERLERLIELLVAGEEIPATDVDASDEFYELVQRELATARKDGNQRRAEVLDAVAVPMARYRDSERLDYLVDQHLRGRRPRLFSSDSSESFRKLVDKYLHRARSKQQVELINALTTLAERIDTRVAEPESSERSRFGVAEDTVSVKCACPVCETEFSVDARVLLAINNPSIVRRSVLETFFDETNCPNCRRRCAIDVPVLFLNESPMRGAFFLSADASRDHARNALLELVDSYFSDFHWQERMVFLQAILIATNVDELIRLATCSDEEFEREKNADALFFRHSLDEMETAAKLTAMIDGLTSGQSVAFTDSDATDELIELLRLELERAASAGNERRTEVVRQMLDTFEGMRGNGSSKSRGFRGTPEVAQRRALEAYNELEGLEASERLERLFDAVQFGTPMLLHVDDAHNESLVAMAEQALKAAIHGETPDRVIAIEQVVKSFAMLRRSLEEEPLRRLCQQLRNHDISLADAIPQLNRPDVLSTLDDVSLEMLYREVHWGSVNLETFQATPAEMEMQFTLARFGYEAAKLAATERVRYLFASRLGELLLATNPHDAIDIWQDALRWAGTDDNLEGEAVANGNLGIAYMKLSQNAKAIQFARRGVELSKKLADRGLEGSLLINLAKALSAQGDLQEAHNLLKQAQFLKIETGGEGGRALVIAEIGSILQQKGELRDAIRCHQAAVHALDAVDDKANLLVALNRLATAYVDLGDATTGIECFERALRLEEELGGQRWTSGTLDNLAMTYDRLGDSEIALEYQTRAVQLREQYNDQLGMAKAYRNLGLIHRRSGDLQNALENFNLARQLYQQLEHTREESRVWQNLGLVHDELGDVPTAVDYLNHACRISRANKDRDAEASVLADVGAVYSRAGQVDEAITHFKESMQVFREIGSRSGEGRVLSQMATAWMAHAHRAEALNDHDVSNQARRNALRDARAAAQIHKELGDRPMHRHDLAQMGMLYEDSGHLYEARENYRHAFTLFEWQRERLEQGPHKDYLRINSIDIWTRGIGVALQLATNELDSVVYGEEGFEYAEAGKSRLLLDVIGHHAGHISAESEENQERLREFYALAARQERVCVSGAGSSPKKSSGPTNEISNVLDEFTDQETAAILSIRPMDIAAARRALPPSTALLEYAIVPHLECCALFVVSASNGLIANPWRIALNDITRDRSNFYETLTNMQDDLAQSRNVVDARPCHTDSSHDSSSPFRAYWDTVARYQEPFNAALAKLGATLIPPDLVNRLISEGIERLIIVPDGPIYDIPFAGLRVSMEGHETSILGEDSGACGFELALAPSMGAFDRCRRKMSRRADVVSPNAVRTLMLSDPNFNRPKLALPGVSDTVERLRNELFVGGSTVHLRQHEATRDGLLKLAPSAHINIFYGHGNYDPDNALNSCLHMHSNGDPDTETTDPVRAFELIKGPRDERFDACSLFVMAACWGGRLDPFARWDSREIVGLASTLFQRGVASLIGAQWPATVGPTTGLFQAFFERYLAGQPASFALRQAMSELRRHDSRWNHPYFWAPFYLMGDYKAWP